MVEHSAVNYTAEHHKPLFWRRLATKLSPLVVPQLCPQLAFLNILSLDSLQDHELLFFRCASFLQKEFPRTYPNDAQLDYLRIANNPGVGPLMTTSASIVTNPDWAFLPLPWGTD